MTPLQGDVSLVVPLQDEEDTIDALLLSVAAQVQRPSEIILVDAGSRDATRQRAAAHSSLPLRIISTDRVYPGVARNVGVEAAVYDWIAFTDGGIHLDVHWLAELTRAAPDVDVVYGGCEPICDSLFREAAAIAYITAKDRSGTRGPFIASCLMRREAFARAGGFPPFRASEDLIFIRRLRDMGARAGFAPRAIARWQIAGTPAATFRRFESYSYHNLVAGWGRHWHLGVARLYGMLALAILVVSLVGGRRWALPMAVLFFAARATKAAYTKRRSFAFPTLTLARMAGAAGVLVLIDLATLAGWVRWVVAKPKR